MRAWNLLKAVVIHLLVLALNLPAGCEPVTLTQKLKGNVVVIHVVGKTSWPPSQRGLLEEATSAHLDQGIRRFALGLNQIYRLDDVGLAAVLLGVSQVYRRNGRMVCFGVSRHRELFRKLQIPVRILPNEEEALLDLERYK